RGRLERGRQGLRRRLARRGLAVSAPLLAAALAQPAAAAVPPALLTVRAARHALHVAAGETGLLPAPLANLIREVSSPMTLLSFKAMFLTCVAVLVVAFLAVGQAYQTGTVPADNPAAEGPAPQAAEVGPAAQPAGASKPAAPKPAGADLKIDLQP